MVCNMWKHIGNPKPLETWRKLCPANGTWSSPNLWGCNIVETTTYFCFWHTCISLRILNFHAVYLYLYIFLRPFYLLSVHTTTLPFSARTLANESVTSASRGRNIQPATPMNLCFFEPIVNLKWGILRFVEIKSLVIINERTVEGNSTNLSESNVRTT